MTAAVERPDAVEARTAVVKTRIEGINYYFIDVLNIALGSGNDVFNIQGTSTETNLYLGAGDERVYISSEANETLTSDTDFLRGHLHNINGTLYIDAGTGSHQLMVSGEASMLDNDDIEISDIADSGENSDGEIFIRGLTGGDNAFGWVDLPQATIIFRADAGSANNFAQGITIWTGFGADTIWIDGTHYRSGVRTVTILNTGLGDDTVWVNLHETESNGDDTAD